MVVFSLPWVKLTLWVSYFLSPVGFIYLVLFLFFFFFPPQVSPEVKSPALVTLTLGDIYYDRRLSILLHGQGLWEVMDGTETLTFSALLFVRPSL